MCRDAETNKRQQRTDEQQGVVREFVEGGHDERPPEGLPQRAPERGLAAVLLLLRPGGLEPV